MPMQTQKRTSMVYKGLLCMVSLCTLWGCEDTKISYASMSKEKLQQVYNTNIIDISNMRENIEAKKATQSQYKKDKKRLKSLRGDITKTSTLCRKVYM